MAERKVTERRMGIELKSGLSINQERGYAEKCKGDLVACGDMVGVKARRWGRAH